MNGIYIEWSLMALYLIFVIISFVLGFNFSDLIGKGINSETFLEFLVHFSLGIVIGLLLSTFI